MKLTTKIIADKVIEVTGCNIRLRNRNPDIIKGRWIYTKLCKTFLNDSLTNIGREINLNHATVTHNLKQIDNPYKFDLNCQNLFNSLANQIKDEFEIKLSKELKIDKTDIHNTKEIERLKLQLKRATKDLIILHTKLDIKLETIKDLRLENTKLVERNLKLSLKL